MSKSFKTFLKHTAKDYYNQSVNPPVVRASTIIFKSMNELRKTQSKGKKNPIGGHFEYGRQGTSTTFILQQMLKINDLPIVFALSNPTSNSECTAKDVFSNTKGRAIFSSGSPFKSIINGEKKFHTSQANNAYVFSGIGLGVLLSKIDIITDEIFLNAAHTLSKMTSQDDLKNGKIYFYQVLLIIVQTQVHLSYHKVQMQKDLDRLLLVCCVLVQPITKQKYIMVQPG